MKNSFTTICLLRNIFLATMCTWSSVNVERWPLWDMTFFLQQLLWDMTILRLDIFPTSTIMRHDHFETWNFSHTNHYEKRPFWDMFFCNYITWSTNIFFPLAPNNQHQNNHLLDLFFEQQMQAEQSLRKVVTFVSNTLPMGVQASSILL